MLEVSKDPEFDRAIFGYFSPINHFQTEQKALTDAPAIACTKFLYENTSFNAGTLFSILK